MTQELLNYFNGDTMAAQVWFDKYAVEGEVTPDDMHKRLAKEYSNIEWKYREGNLDKTNLSTYGKKYIEKLQKATPKDVTDHIYNLFKDFKYIIPAGSVMANLGKDTPTSLSNCFVLGQPKDNIESIFNYARDSAQLFKRRGGVGIDLSLLRPNGAGVKNAANSSSGPVSFIEVYSATTKTIGQDGRRAAEMISIDIRHPDIFEFIKCKSDKDKTTAANISVKIGSDFMEAVANDSDYILRFPCTRKVPNVVLEDKTLEYNRLLSITGDLYYKRIKAKELWNSICQHAHDDAEPGIIFEDNHLEYDPAAVYPEYKPVTTNPCGEIFMGPKDSCRLSAINLYSFVKTPFGKNPTIDFDKLYEVSYEQLVLSDDLVDLEIEAIDRILGKIDSDYIEFYQQILKENVDTILIKRFHKDFLANSSAEFKLWWEIRENGRKGRRVGNGFTALGDMIAAMNLKYGSDECNEIIQGVLHTKMQAELDASIDLAILRGAFEGWNDSLEYEEVQTIDAETDLGINNFYHFILCVMPNETIDRMRQYGRRNVSWSTVAPTGTTSLMTQTTSGIEPLFKAVYKRRVKVEEGPYDFKSEDGQLFKEYLVVHPKLADFAANGLGYLKEVIAKFTEKDWLEMYQQSPYFESTANDISWKERIDLQALVQQYTTHSISSTINLPKTASVNEVSQLYMYANEKKLKGITVYVDESREGILVTSGPNKGLWKPADGRRAPERPKVLSAKLTPIKSKGINYAVIVGFLENKPYEVFAYELATEEKACSGHVIKVKRGVYNFISPEYTAFNIQLANDKVEEKACTLYTSMLLREGAEINHIIKTAKKVNENITSFSSAMCRVLAKYAPKEYSRDLCPNCGQPLKHEAGCVKCDSCTFSKCLLMYKHKIN